jgi:hypothetical protein
MEANALEFMNSASLKGREDRYVVVCVDVAAILKSWRNSLFSFEWLTPEGGIRNIDDLPLHERDKRLKVEKHLKAGDVLQRPVLGIGMLDNVEIGAGRDVFLTLAAQGLRTVEAHIPASNQKDFKPFLGA